MLSNKHVCRLVYGWMDRWVSVYIKHPSALLRASDDTGEGWGMDTSEGERKPNLWEIKRVLG